MLMLTPHLFKYFIIQMKIASTRYKGSCRRLWQIYGLSPLRTANPNRDRKSWEICLVPSVLPINNCL
ncbi:hypothetical protein RJT34_10674 [Clitoria ternatea]|uniref:Uncharacterized protein n=1 Tax=Clitoria ternatea TaxID=43366 RepID=A0AAN9JKF0_CLITE